MKHLKIIILTLIVVALTSCDYTMYVAVRNYKEPCRVSVAYQKSGNTFFDSDTLLIRPLGYSQVDSFLIRVNDSADLYHFIAPGQREIALRPKSLGNPIRQVEIINTPDSSWTINLRSCLIIFLTF